MDMESYIASISLPPSPLPTPAEASLKKHHLPKGYTIPWSSNKLPATLRLTWTIILRALSRDKHKTDPTPPVLRTPIFLSSRNDVRDLRATWLGHAAYYLEFPSGLRVLTDPVFEERCSPFSFLGPKRVSAAPAQVDDLPYVDIVLISHNHYDHMSYPTLTKIAKRFPNAQFFVPLGNAAWFHKNVTKKVTELDWWDTRDVSLSPASDIPSSAHNGASNANSGGSGRARYPSYITARLSLLPCVHQSGRSPFDRNATLWGSWSIESDDKKVYFAGDTSYRTVPRKAIFESRKTSIPEDKMLKAEQDLPSCPVFKEIGTLRGPFDLGLIPIGAYAPRWLFSPMHGDPYDAVEIFLDTQCKNAMAIHWGTWVLTEEDVLEPPKLLADALKRKKIDKEARFQVCEIGESRSFW